MCTGAENKKLRLKYKIVLRKQCPDIKIRECGLFVGTNTPFLGVSPDGIIEYTDNGKKMKGVLEIKCPASDKWRSLSPDVAKIVVSTQN